MEYLGVVAESALAPTYEVQIHLLLKFLWDQRMPNHIDEFFEALNNDGDSFAVTASSAGDYFQFFEDLLNGSQYFPDLIVKDLILITSDNAIVVVQIGPSGF